MQQWPVLRDLDSGDDRTVNLHMVAAERAFEKHNMLQPDETVLAFFDATAAHDEQKGLFDVLVTYTAEEAAALKKELEDASPMSASGSESDIGTKIARGERILRPADEPNYFRTADANSAFRYEHCTEHVRTTMSALEGGVFELQETTGYQKMYPFEKRHFAKTRQMERRFLCFSRHHKDWPDLSKDGDSDLLEQLRHGGPVKLPYLMFKAEDHPALVDASLYSYENPHDEVNYMGTHANRAKERFMSVDVLGSMRLMHNDDVTNYKCEMKIPAIGTTSDTTVKQILRAGDCEYTAEGRLQSLTFRLVNYEQASNLYAPRGPYDAPWGTKQFTLHRVKNALIGFS